MPAAVSAGALITAPAMAGGWVTYTNETSIRLSAQTALGAGDVDEKDYDYGDVDHDGDLDLIVVRKEPWTIAFPGGRPNVLFMNENGVLTDRTSAYIPGFLDATNDRDVHVVDVDNDTWPDIVVAAACNGTPCGTASESRLYMNLGDGGDAVWDGYGPPQVLFTGRNFCDVGAGDVSGDDYPDLYFASYNDTLEDQLLINGGIADPGAFTVENNRLTTSMRTSNFGTAAWIADMNGDGTNDIVKSENGPIEVYNNNLLSEGFFNILQSTYTAAAYHSGVGDLNNDGKLDIIVSDDGTDVALVNSGNGANGMANYSQVTLPPETNGFGANSYVIDLDGDNWRDVIICDVDVDAPGCSRVTKILRNTGGGTLVIDQANLPESTLTGVHDIAAFDVDGDALPDLVVGKCSGTQVWINSPPIEIAFDYPKGLPDMVAPQVPSDFVVQLTPVGDTIVPGSTQLFVAINDGAFTAVPLVHQSGNEYSGTLPAAQCADRYAFYISAQVTSGLTFTDPPSAPSGSHVAVATEGVEVVLEDQMENPTGGQVPGWTVTNDPSLFTGAWEAVVPIVTVFNGNVANPFEDATPDGAFAYVTDNPAFPNQDAPLSDVDGGPTRLISPVIDLSGTDAFISYAYWVFSDIGIHDVLVVEVSNDGGSSWSSVESLGETEGAWTTSGFLVGSVVPPTSQVRVRFLAADVPSDSVTEMGIDDFVVTGLICSCPQDLDGNGEVNVTDLLALLAAWNTNPGGPPDFDGNGAVDVSDLLALLAAWGTCP